MILDFPSEKPDFGTSKINIPNLINLNVDKEDIIEYKDLKNAINNILKKNNENETVFLMMDKLYYKADYKNFERFLYINTWAHQGNYEVSFNDCDDYAFRIYGMFCQDNWSGLPVGVILWDEPKHADPFFVDDTMTPYVIINYNKIIPLDEYQKENYEANIVII